MMNGDTPNAITGAITRKRIRRFLGRIFKTVLSLNKNFNTHAADTACESIVARAAPFTPMRNPNINTGSSTIFRPAPIKVVNIAIRANPCEVINAFIPVVIKTNTEPRT